MRYKIGAEQVEQVQSLARRPDGVFNSTRTTPVGPAHAVDATTGAVACGITAHELTVLDQDWEAACFVEKCPSCFAAVGSHGKIKAEEAVPAASSAGAESPGDGETEPIGPPPPQRPVPGAVHQLSRQASLALGEQDASLPESTY